MAAIGIGVPLYVIVQASIAVFVYRESKNYNRRSPAIVAGAVFIFSIAVLLVVNNVLAVFIVQAVVTALYLGARSLTKRTDNR